MFRKLGYSKLLMRKAVQSYQEVREQSGLRRRFVKNVDLDWARKYIRRVLYVPYDDPHTPQGAMYTLPSMWSNFGIPYCRSTIYVHPYAFEWFSIEGDFLSALIDHEGQHAQDFSTIHIGLNLHLDTITLFLASACNVLPRSGQFVANCGNKC